jgi:hypothetical protein
VALSNHRSVRLIQTEWRADLPAIAWDGGILVARGRDVVVLDPVTLEGGKTMRNGANDYWHFFTWNGFRQRALDDPEPVNFPVFVDHNEFELPRRRQAEIDDSIRAAQRDAFRSDSIARASAARSKLPSRGIFTVSFAVLRSDTAARRLARSIRVRGQTPRVVPAFVDATPIYRVVLGPFQSRAEAEAVGRAARVPYWVYEGPP